MKKCSFLWNRVPFRVLCENAYQSFLWNRVLFRVPSENAYQSSVRCEDAYENINCEISFLYTHFAWQLPKDVKVGAQRLTA